MNKKILIILFFVIVLFISFSFLNNVSAQDKTLSKVLITKPTRINYIVGEKIDLSGMKVVAIYSDGTEEEVTKECTYAWTITCEGAGNHDGYITYDELEGILNSDSVAGRKVSDKEREYTVVATYGEMETESFKINVSAQDKTLSKVLITKPTRINYIVGEKIDLSGMKVVAIYSDGTEEEVTKECTYAWTITCEGAGNHDGYITYDELEGILNSDSVAGRKVSDKEREYTVVATYNEIESELFKITVNDNTLADKTLPKTGLKTFGFLTIVILIIVSIIFYKKYEKLQ